MKKDERLKPHTQTIRGIKVDKQKNKNHKRGIVRPLALTLKDVYEKENKSCSKKGKIRPKA